MKKIFLISTLSIICVSCFLGGNKKNGNRELKPSVDKTLNELNNNEEEKENESVWQDIIQHLHLPASAQVENNTAKIKFQNTDCDYYNDKRYNYDDLLIEIMESEFNSIHDSYVNVYIDSNEVLKSVKGTFTVDLQNGRKKILREIELEKGGDQMIDLGYIGYLPSFNCYAFSFLGLISNGILFVSRTNGDVYPFRGFPLFTPDKNLFSIVRLDGDADDVGTIIIYGIVDNMYQFLFGLWSDRLLPISACWGDNNILFIEAYDSKEQINKYYKLNLFDL